MSAPKENAVGDNKQAPYFAKAASLELLPKNTYFGKIEIKSTTGPTIAANFELEKKTAIRKLSVISDM